jgi:hypothetical protein
MANGQRPTDSLSAGAFIEGPVFGDRARERAFGAAACPFGGVVAGP